MSLANEVLFDPPRFADNHGASQGPTVVIVDGSRDDYGVLARIFNRLDSAARLRHFVELVAGPTPELDR